MKKCLFSLDDESVALIVKHSQGNDSFVVRKALKLLDGEKKSAEPSARVGKPLPEIDKPMPGKLIQNRAMILLKRIEDPNDEVSENDIALFLKQLI